MGLVKWIGYLVIVGISLLVFRFVGSWTVVLFGLWAGLFIKKGK